MNVVGTNHKSTAAWNRRLTLRLLREHGTLSRQQISQITHLRGSTLSYIVRELLEKNLVRVVGKRQSSLVGQKQVLLTLNPDVGWLLGVSLRPGEATLVLLDAAGGRIDGTTLPISTALESLPLELHQGLRRWLGDRGAPAGRLLAMGVGVPGVVDVDSGVVLRSHAFQAVNVPLQRALVDEFGRSPAGAGQMPLGGSSDLTVTIDHDARYGASAEAADGVAAKTSHFLYVSINYSRVGDRVRFDSYGSALYLEGRLYRGAFYAAGEMAFCLEPQTLETSESDLQAIADPDAELSSPLTELAARIAQSLAPMINFIDVQMIVLAGAARIANKKFVSAVQQQLSSQMIPVPDRSVRVVASMFEPEGTARGAAVAAFDAAVANGGLLGTNEAGQPQRSVGPARSHAASTAAVTPPAG